MLETSGASMKRINIDLLDPADILLTTSSDKKTSGVIRLATHSDISHALIYVERHSVIDSTGDLVQARNTQRMFYDDNLPIYAVKPKVKLSPEQVEIIIRFCRASIGTMYSMTEAVQAQFKLSDSPNSDMFCSRLVALAYDKAGIKIVENPSYCTPEELKKSEFFNVIDASESVSQKEIDAITSIRDLSDEMRMSQIFLMNGLKKILPNLTNMSEIEYILAHNLHLDTRVLKVYRDSKYLDLCDEEYRTHIYRYNEEILVKKVGLNVELYNYAIETLNTDGSRHKQRCEQIKNYTKNYNLKTFKELEKLYKKIYDRHLIRLNVAKKILQKHFAK